MISKLDFVGIPSQDAERSRTFYIDTLTLRPRRQLAVRGLGGRDVLRHLGAESLRDGAQSGVKHAKRDPPPIWLRQ
jgi:catechol 2,3-dioxygenase-like lactoylglutathione lyase family enzyme